MIRSGSTLQYQITKAIVEETNNGKALGWVDGENINEIITNNIDKTYIKIVKSHSYLPQFDMLKNVRYVYSYRDIRDVAVSQMNKYKKKYKDLNITGLVLNLIETNRSWIKMENILISRYEIFRNNIYEETNKIAAFLGINISEELTLQISNDLTIEKQIEKIKKLKNNKHSDVFKYQHNTVDRRTLLHDNHIHKGQINAYKEQLSFFEIAHIEFIGYQWLKENNYKLQLPYTISFILGNFYKIYRKLHV